MGASGAVAEPVDTQALHACLIADEASGARAAAPAGQLTPPPASAA
ncbi:hypothetical protein [Vineibacter terrae]|nr:hypothetical protein [Vineibacter terrae]HEX2891114.1 hypothetical protein [Vineibacter terrae]